MDEGAGERQPAAHPAGQLGDRAAHAIGQLDERRGRGRSRRGSACALEAARRSAGSRPPRGPGRGPRPGACSRSRPSIWRDGIRVPRIRASPRGRDGPGRQQPDERGLAGAVRSEQAVDPARGKGEVDPVDGVNLRRSASGGRSPRPRLLVPRRDARPGAGRGQVPQRGISMTDGPAVSRWDP